MTEILKIDHLFEDYRRFPWDVLGLTVPKAGPLHSYLCSILADFAPPDDWRGFMKGLPSMRELNRAARLLHGSGHVIVDIQLYTESHSSLRLSERVDVAQEVLDFLSRHKEYRAHAQKTLDRLWRQGLICVPGRCLP